MLSELEFPGSGEVLVVGAGRNDPGIYESGFFAMAPEPELTGLAIVSAGRFVTARHAVLDRTRDDHLVLLCRGGRGWARIGRHEQAVRAATWFWAPPDVPHAYACDRREGWDILYVHFRGPLADRLHAAAALPPAMPVQPATTAMSKACGVIAARALVGDYPAGLDAVAALYGLLLRILGRRRQLDIRQRGIAPALAGEPRSVAEMAASCGMSKYHFIRSFKASVGVTPWRYAIARRISRAKVLLTGTNRPVGAVARAVGFADPDYFARVFHRETGTSPSRFRRQPV